MPKPLPDPECVAPEFCVRCGYSLTGLAAPGRCPECGASFLEKQLVLYGVPRSTTGTSITRRVLWLLLIIAAVVYSQAWVWLVMKSWVFATGFAGAIIGGVVALLLTSRRERSGAERLVISPLGVVRLPLENPREHTRFDSAVAPWGSATGVELKRVSPVWYRIRIGTATRDGHVEDTIVDAGIRCTDALAPHVRQMIEWHLAQARTAQPVDPASV